MIAATSIIGLLSEHASLVAGAGIVLIGLLVLGLRDVLRFSPGRTWAIASVCFRQSIRRRVLWITPLVIAGVIVVSQFQKPVDAQDEVRQTTGYCLFATGLLLVMVSVILACTNIPRDIETRVIYTVATKPTTRLEIILGKVVGFACVSFWILLIMGLFTLGYLHVRDWQLRQSITELLARLPKQAEGRPTLEYYRDKGTLHARQLAVPSDLLMLSHKPREKGDFWIPAVDGELLVRFTVDRSLIPPDAPLVAAMTIKATKLPNSSQGPQTAASTQPAAEQASTPRAAFDLRYSNHETAVPRNDLGLGNGEELPGGLGQVVAVIPPPLLDRWVAANAGPTDVYIAITGLTPGWCYSVPSIVDREASRAAQHPPQNDFVLLVPPEATGGRKIEFKPSGLIFGSQRGTYGQQLKGGRQVPSRVALFQFESPNLQTGRKSYPFELRAGIEPDYSEPDADVEQGAVESSDDANRQPEANLVVLDFQNLTTGKGVNGIEVHLDNNRPAYFEVPAEAVEGGSFRTYVRLSTSGYLGLRSGQGSSLRLAIADQSFAWNLLKSLGILWLMSLLVIIVAVFCSTFLSWPIAVVLTLVILASHWGVQQLGDLAQPGVGRQIVQDMFKGSNVATSRAVSESVDALVKMLNKVSSVLPDISKYAAIEDIQRGVAISPHTLLEALRVTLGYGIPLMVLSYIFLKHKEVAP